jgi:hypothetical protein
MWGNLVGKKTVKGTREENSWYLLRAYFVMGMVLNVL